ncbi:MAG: ABC transporter ATP-binding protein [Paenibacillaceae bacterium]
MSEPIIKLTQLTKKYGEHTAVDRLDLQIQRGEVFGLLGPNGAGKSTTILMILGLTEPTSGKAVACGLDSTRYPMEVKKRVGYLPDDVGFYEDRSGLDNLVYTARLNRIPVTEAHRRAWELLERVGLKEVGHKKTGTYSRGMRQRLGLADVLIKQPEVIILDEPTLGIDPEGVRELLELIHRLSREEGITVLISSHHLHQMQQICDRVGLFVRGKLLAEGDLATLAARLFIQEQITIELGMETDNPESILEQIRAFPDVIRVEQSGEYYVIGCSRDLTNDLSHAVINSGAILTHLNRRQFGLDEIYHRYFEGGETHAGDRQAEKAMANT